MSSELLVTVAVPVYKRLEYLPEVLNAIASQDYPAIELLVSDNGNNGSLIPEIVRKHYHKRFRFRQNAATVDLPVHLNQLLDEATGHYFVLLCDDDQINPNYISTMVAILERYPRAGVAYSKIEAIDEKGKVIFSHDEEVPEIMDGLDFIRKWCSFPRWLSGPIATNLARTEELRERGRHPLWPRALNTDFAIAVRMALNADVAINSRAVFRQRRYVSKNTSIVSSAGHREFAVGCRLFLEFLDTDPFVHKFALDNPATWLDLKPLIVRRIWGDYLHWWRYVYAPRLSRLEWIRAAFLMPYLPQYYAAVLVTFFPRAYQIYRRLMRR